MTFKLEEKCDNSKNREFFYRAKINKDIKDVYLGTCFLEPNEKNRKVGPGRGHEELLYLLKGQIKITLKEEDIILNGGEIYFIPDGNKVVLENLTEKRIYFFVAGGHTKIHSH